MYLASPQRSRVTESQSAPGRIRTGTCAPARHHRTNARTKRESDRDACATNAGSIHSHCVRAHACIVAPDRRQRHPASGHPTERQKLSEHGIDRDLAAVERLHVEQDGDPLEIDPIS